MGIWPLRYPRSTLPPPYYRRTFMGTMESQETIETAILSSTNT